MGDTPIIIDPTKSEEAQNEPETDESEEQEKSE